MLQSTDHDIILRSEDDTIRLARSFASVLKVGDVLLLSGSIGAGKSFFCRAVIRARTQTSDDIPSPTFTLVQSYPHADGEIWHCDLYRLTNPDEAIELGLDDAFETAICLIEWPDRLGRLAPQNALSLTFSARDDHHSVHINAPIAWANRLRFLHEPSD